MKCSEYNNETRWYTDIWLKFKRQLKGLSRVAYKPGLSSGFGGATGRDFAPCLHTRTPRLYLTGTAFGARQPFDNGEHRRTIFLSGDWVLIHHIAHGHGFNLSPSSRQARFAGGSQGWTLAFDALEGVHTNIHPCFAHIRNHYQHKWWWYVLNAWRPKERRKK